MCLETTKAKSDRERKKSDKTESCNSHVVCFVEFDRMGSAVPFSTEKTTTYLLVNPLG